MADEKEYNDPLCQSCGMPMEGPEDCGSEADGSRCVKYCRFCYTCGMFSEPDITLDQMIEKVVGIMMEMEVMPEAQVREIAKTFMPGLERWRKQ